MEGRATSALDTRLGEASAPSPARAAAWLGSARGMWLVAAVALVLALPSLGDGLSSDDHVARWNALQERMPNPLSSFALEPRAGMNRDHGVLAWWSSPQLHLRFFRPLSAFSHGDFALWPNAPWLSHACNVLLYVALTMTAWTLYRTLLVASPAVAGLAALWFAWDEGHAHAVGWIASRNSLLSAWFVLLALLFHVQWRSAALQRQRYASVACVLLALLSGEASIVIVSYLAAYEWAFERDGLRARLARHWPSLSLVAVWAVSYVLGDYGSRGASFYRDLSRPLSVLAGGLMDLPLWLAGLVGPSLISLSMTTPFLATRLLAAALALPLCAALIMFTPRTRPNAFFALGALLCLPPLFTTLPQDRVLILASFGAFGVLASFCSAAKTAASRSVRAARWFLIAIHGVLAPLMFIPMLRANAPVERGTQALVRALPTHPPKQVILLNSPIELLTLYAPYVAREQPGRTPPEQLQQLYAGASAVEVTRLDERTLELRVHNGWGVTPFERIFGRIEDMPQPGEVVQLEQLEVRVQEQDAQGHPTRVQFRFPSPLEAPERAFYAWRGTRPEPWRPPPPGQHEVLAPLSIFGSL